MKIGLSLVIVLLVLTFLFALKSLYITVKDAGTRVNIEITNIEGFEASEDDPELHSVIDRINRRKSELSAAKNKIKTCSVITSFIVVCLSALATLLTSIYNFKKTETLTNKLTIWVFILSFISTLTGSVTMYINNELQEVDGKLKRAAELRESAFVEYPNAKLNHTVKIFKLKYESSLADLE